MLCSSEITRKKQSPRSRIASLWGEVDCLTKRRGLYVSAIVTLEWSVCLSWALFEFVLVHVPLLNGVWISKCASWWLLAYSAFRKDTV